MLRMLRFFLSLSCLLLSSFVAFGARVRQDDKLTPQQILRKYARYIVTIKANGVTGTGFIDKGYHVYTCYHLIKGAPSITIRFFDGKEVTSSTITAVDRERDIAMLDSIDIGSLAGTRYFIPENGVPSPPQLGGYNEAVVGDKLVVLSDPKGPDGSISEVLVSAKKEIDHKKFVQLSAAVSAGSSGSPIFGEYGTVVAMVGQELKPGVGVNLGISSNDLGSVSGLPLNMVDWNANAGASVIERAVENSKDSEKDYPLRHLIGTRIVIENNNEQPPFVVGPEDIQKPFEGLCKELDIRVLSEADVKLLKSDHKGDDAILLLAQDALHCFMEINWSVDGFEDHKTVTIALNVKRGVLMSTQLFASIFVYQDIEFQEISEADDPKALLKQCVETLISRFKEKFKADNADNSGLLHAKSLR